jgi:hypothetical protein
LLIASKDNNFVVVDKDDCSDIDAIKLIVPEIDAFR